MKLTPWFGCSTKPVRPGVYERVNRKMWFRVYAKWDGEKWWLGYSTVDGAANSTTVSKAQTGFFWRGVMK